MYSSYYWSKPVFVTATRTRLIITAERPPSARTVCPRQTRTRGNPNHCYCYQTGGETEAHGGSLAADHTLVSDGDMVTAWDAQEAGSGGFGRESSLWGDET